MSARRVEDLLSRLHQDAPAPSPHRQALRAELVARFRARPGAAGRSRRALPRLAVGLVFAAGLLAASQAPAEYPVEVGRRVEIVAAAPAAGWPSPLELRPVLEQAGRTRQIELRAHRGGGRAASLTIDLWGPEVATDVAARLRAAFPALATAQITEAPLEATARGKLGGLLGHMLIGLRADPAAIEAARQELQARLRAAGAEGDVDIQVEEQDGRRKVLVQVRATQTVDAADGGPAPAP